MKTNILNYDWQTHLKNCQKWREPLFLTGNPEGYQININHPYINERYNAFLKWKGISPFYPVNRKNRLEFEAYIKNDKGFITLIREQTA